MSKGFSLSNKAKHQAEQRSCNASFVNIIEADGAATHASVASLSANTFTLTDGLVLPSPIILLNGVAFMWDVKAPNPTDGSWDGWDPEKLAIFEKITPRPGPLMTLTAAAAAAAAAQADSLRS